MQPVERDELEFLAATGRMLGASLDDASKLGALAALLVPALADHCALYVVTRDGRARQVGALSVDAAMATALRATHDAVLAADAAGLVGVAVASGRPERLEPSHAARAAVERGTAVAAIASADLATLHVLPLRARERVLGVMVLATAASRPTEARAARLADEVAERAAQALDNARLYDEARVGAMRLEVLAEASRVFAEAGLETGAAVDAIVYFIGEFLADGCVLSLASPDGTRLDTVAVHHPIPAIRAMLDALFKRPFRSDEGLPGRVYGSGEPVLLSVFDVATVPRDARTETHRYFADAKPHSILVVPLRRGDKVVGTLAVARERPGPSYDAADVSLLRDLAERATLLIENARLYREARDASRLKDEFLGTLSHELRTPLTSILGWAWMLRAGRVDPATLPRAIATIERNALAQARLIDDLLDVSRIVAGKVHLQLEPTDLGALVSAAVETIRPMAAARDVELRVAIERVDVRGDPQRLQQVALNLLSNAVKFTPDGGAVTVTVARATRDGGAYAELVVADTGRGIPAAFLPYVFDRFRQADSTSTRSQGGLGLGLAIARHIAELHGGAIRADSAGTGLGAVFTVSLPTGATARVVTHVASDVASGSALRGVRVLLVDDEADTRDVLAATLRSEGADVTAAGSAREALERIAATRPDLLLSDIGMRDEDGYSLVRAVRALGEPALAGVLAIALTAHARPEDAERARASGFDAHVAKPVDPAWLAARVASAVGVRRGASAKVV